MSVRFGGEQKVSARLRHAQQLEQKQHLCWRNVTVHPISAWPGRSPTTCWHRPERRGAVAYHHSRVLPAGPGPGHGDRADPHAARRRHRQGTGQPGRRTSHNPLPRGPVRAKPRPGHWQRGADHQTRPAGPQQRLEHPRLIGRTLAAAGKPVSRRALRSNGVKGSNEALNTLARQINVESVFVKNC